MASSQPTVALRARHTAVTAAAAVARPGARAWLRPSLQRRAGVALALASVIGFVVLGDSAVTVANVARGPDYYSSCGGWGRGIAVLPVSCDYSAAAKLTGITIMLALLALMAWAWWLLAGWALRPLTTTAETVRRLGPQNLGQRIGLDSGQDAFRELADAVDGALDRLASGYESQRRFAANASHELRTPLAVQRLVTEVAMDDPAAGPDLRRLGTQLLRTNEHSEQLIEGMLTLAESDRGLEGKVPVRLDQLAATELDAHQEQADRQQVTLRPKLAEAAVAGDPVLLGRLIANLIGNAIKYNVAGGWVEVEVTAARSRPGQPAAQPGSSGAVIVVRNTGAPVAPWAIPMMFEPFRRLGGDRVAGRGGVGLGLAIVRSIVTAHEADLQARPRPDGGLEIEIELPAG